MATNPTPRTHNPSEHEAAKIGWRWSEMTWRARFVLVGTILVGAALVLGVLIIATELDEDSPLRRGLLALLLFPLGVAGAAAWATTKTEKASQINTARSLRSEVMRWLITIGVLAGGAIAIALIGSLMTD